MAGSTIDYIADWAKRLRSRLYTQFRDDPSWQAWTDDVLGPQFQDLEDAGQSLLTLLDIANSVGAQLDVIGRIVGQPRNGTDDTTYRLYLSARVVANKSSGTVEDIFNVMRALFGATAGPRYQGGLVKQFAIRLVQALTRSQALIGVGFLADSKEAGARAILQWSESSTDDTFNFCGIDPAPEATVAALFSGSTDLVLSSAASTFPSSGRVYLGLGRPSFREYLTYTSKSFDGTNYHLTTTAQPFNFHPIGVVVACYPAGKGFDEGALSGAVEA